MKNRIVIISEDFAAPFDEGIKKFAVSVGGALSRQNDVLLLNVDRSGVGEHGALRVPSTKTFAGRPVRRHLRAFAPDVVLYVPSPSSTLGSFVRSFWLRRHAPRAVLGMVALIPRRHGAVTGQFLKSMAPDKIFVPSYASLLHLHTLSLTGDLVSVGVDLSVFRRPQAGERRQLRRKHHLAEDGYVYLHVGHLSRKRNLNCLRILLESKDTSVVVIGSTSTPEDAALRRELEAAGVRVIREYVAVEEFYRLADCYVFPVEDSEGCVEIPLSVFEALASGIPVLSTPFGGLRDFLPAGNDLMYWDSESALRESAVRLRAGGAGDVRGMEDFTWETVAKRIMDSLLSSV